ncbi:MAG: M48 family metalloprotease [Holosporaceae bacterium]|jgi:predicted Zn-dependent protease|nr:M48 family metalloprotease [Holosporaceae bacterium]
MIYLGAAFCEVRAEWRIIRDAEIEETLREIAGPIFRAAGLRPESAKIYVLHSEIINAFTVGNGYIFITSGLLLRFENLLHLIGVLCHEVGHMAAGHVERHAYLLQQRSQNFMIAMLAGILGTSLTGSPDAIALLLGYGLTDERFYLRFSRGEELAADALAVSYLEKLGYDAEALIGALEIFQHVDILNGGVNLPAYVLTHPKVDNRISALHRRPKSGKHEADEVPSRKYKRILTKLRCYLGEVNPFAEFSKDDYSQAIYHHRCGKSAKAVALLRNLVKKNPSDLYYKETLAQVLYESGNLSEAIKIYEQICSNNVNVLINIDYANALLEANQKIDAAIEILESAKYSMHLDSDVLRLLAKAYGKKKKEGLALLMLALEQIFLGDYAKAHELLTNSLGKMNEKTEPSHYKKAKYFKELLERDYEQGK